MKPLQKKWQHLHTSEAMNIIKESDASLYDRVVVSNYTTTL